MLSDSCSAGHKSSNGIKSMLWVNLGGEKQPKMTQIDQNFGCSEGKLTKGLSQHRSL